MGYRELDEEPLKNAINQNFFKDFVYTQLGRIDFVIASNNTDDSQGLLFNDNNCLESILWAEAKQGTNQNIYKSFVQLILTIGKERTFEKYLPP